MWADNADMCAKQYAGTGALKTDFTRYDLFSISYLRDTEAMLCMFIYCACRTGKRTFVGMLQDGYNSAIRYVYNNFSDGFRQVGCMLIGIIS